MHPIRRQIRLQVSRDVMPKDNMKKIQTFILMILISFLPFLSHSKSCDRVKDPHILNLLPYTVGIAPNSNMQNMLTNIEEGRNQPCLGNFKHLYVDRNIIGADPWEFDLCNIQLKDNVSILFVLTEEGLFALKKADIQDLSNLNRDIIKAKAIKRPLPLD